jgi:hypothetical protein
MFMELDMDWGLIRCFYTGQLGKLDICDDVIPNR